VISLAFALLGCGGESPLAETAAAADPPPGVTLDGPLVLAKAVHAPSLAPQRFSADLPRSWEGVVAGDGPPIGHANDTWCAGDDRMRSQWTSRVADAAAAGADSWTLYSTWGSLALCGGEEAVCRDLRDRYGTEADAATKEMYAFLLSQCGDAETAALLEAGPIGPITYWYQLRGWNGGPWSPRLEKALREAVYTGQAEYAKDIAGLLVNVDPDRAETLVLELRQRASYAMRDALASTLWRARGAQGQAVMTELCGRVSQEADPATGQPLWPECGWRTSSASYTTASPEDLPEWVRQWSADPAGRARTHPDEREAIQQALTQCVRGETSAASGGEAVAPWAVYTCLQRLAQMDRSAAAALAPTVQAAPFADYVLLDQLTAGLVRFPREDDLVRRVREIGLSQGSAVRDERPVVTAEDVLAREGRLYRTVDQGWGWPVAYDHLLRELARMAPDLAEARFEYRQPVWEAEPEPVEPVVEEPASPLAELFAGVADEAEPEEEDTPAYVVTAWDQGQVWRVEARDLGEWPDLDASLGLLNRLLEARGSTLRYAETHDGSVVLAPREALVAADADGVLDLVDPAKRWADEQAAAAEAADYED
jgi:hypothetical protein